MIHHTPRANIQPGSQDAFFIESLKRMVRSHAVFACAERHGSADIAGIAGRVEIYHQARFITLADLFLGICHGVHAGVYEQWALEVRRQAHAFADTLTSLTRAAWLAHSAQYDDASVTPEATAEAVDEAHDALFGDTR